jgi:hypothetical protein
MMLRVPNMGGNIDKKLMSENTKRQQLLSTEQRQIF